MLKYAVVKGWSMMPLLKEGDIVFFKKQTYSVGDIVIFEYNDFLMTHRIIELKDKIITKGDNTPYLDKAIKNEHILGVVEYALRNKRIINLDLKRINQLYVYYSKLEVHTIYAFNKVFNFKSITINFVIKKAFFPLYAFNYFIFNVTEKMMHKANLTK